MLIIWIYTIASVLIVSLISLVGVLTLAVSSKRMQTLLLYLVSFSAGALLGDVFLDLFPEMAKEGFTLQMGIYLLIGFLIFFILERFILWQHSHGEHKEEVHSMTYMVIIGDGVHNLIDGMVIAASFLVSIPLGIATTLAVIFHEIPQELGNFAILVHGGFSKAKALWYNFLSALTAIIGAVIVLIFMRGTEGEPPVFLLSLAASGFIYIALTDIIPYLNREKGIKKSLFQLVWIILGALVMALLLFLE